MRFFKLFLHFVLTSVLFINCQSESKPTQADNNITTKNSFDEQEKVQAKEKPIETTYPQLNGKSIGAFQIGHAIPFNEVPKDYEIKLIKEVVETEEGPSEESFYKVYKGDEELIVIQQDYDFQTDTYSDEIATMTFTNPKIKTPDGIGVGSTIEEFIEVYPKYQIWYTYISDRFVIESEQVDGQFILNNDDHVGDVYPFKDVIYSNKSSFKPNSKIRKIRIL